MMKSHRFYHFYISYLEHKKEQDRISDGALSLLKISESAFNDFVYGYENNPNFKKSIDEIYKKEIRDEKIIDLLNESDRGNHSQ